jgi:hypothetical protein
MSAVRNVKSALGYAKFDDADVALALFSLLAELDKDLDDCGYQETEVVVTAMNNLSEVLNESDTKKEALASKLAEIEAEDREYVDDDDES